MKIQIDVDNSKEPYQVIAFVESIANSGHKFTIDYENEREDMDRDYTSQSDRKKYFDKLIGIAHSAAPPPSGAGDSRAYSMDTAALSLETEGAAEAFIDGLIGDWQISPDTRERMIEVVTAFCADREAKGRRESTEIIELAKQSRLQS